MFAIQNIKTGKFVFGTDYRHHPPHQRTSDHRVLTFDNLATAKIEYRTRRCSKNYRVVCLKPVEVKAIIPFNSGDTYDHTTEDWFTSDV